MRYLLSSINAVMFFYLLVSCESTNQVPLTDFFDPEVETYAFIIPNLAPVSGVGSIKAADCGLCHKKIYQDWQQSTHASALRDIQYQSELAKADSPKWLCLNCHIPLQNQRPYIVTALQDSNIFKPVTSRNPAFDAALQKEAITCATCHIRMDPATGKSYIIGPSGSKMAPHPVKKNVKFLRNMCQRCHNPQGQNLTPNLVCWFYTTTELAEGQAHIKKQFGERKDCVDCHMPAVEGIAADIFPHLEKRQVNQHKWAGGGVPKWYASYDSLLARGYQPGLDITAGPLQKWEDSLSISISFTNTRAGHYIPTGDPERFVLAVAQLLDNQGQEIEKRQYRIGQDWLWNPARKTGDNRLKQGETRQWQAVFSAADAKLAAELAVTTFHVRLNSKTAEHIIAAEGVDENLFENGSKYVREAAQYYPFASYIFKIIVDLNSSKRQVLSPEALIELSKQEAGKPLSERLY